MHRLLTGATATSARRSKGYTSPVNLANLAEQEQSHSSLYLSKVELIKTLMKINCNYFAGHDFPHLNRNSVHSCSQRLSSSQLATRRETLGTRLVSSWFLVQLTLLINLFSK